MAKPFLSDEQWKKIEPLLPQSLGRGRPWADNRRVLEGILLGLKTGARWRDLPPEYPSPSTCWRRLQLWEGQGVWRDVWRQLLAELDARGQLDWRESFVDGSFAPAKKGRVRRQNQAGQGHEVDGGGRRPRCSSGKAPGVGFAGGSEIAGAYAGDGARAAQRSGAVQEPVAAGVADKAYDSDRVRRELRQRGSELICPHRRNRRRPALQDGRKLRRYRKRWKVERTFAWLGNYRRLVVRYEHKIEIYSAFFHVACLLITLRHL